MPRANHPVVWSHVLSFFLCCLPLSIRFDQAFAPNANVAFGVRTAAHSASSLSMATIADGVEFDKIAREWRCKWSADDDKKSLVEAQKALESVLPDVKAVDGVLSVERVVCGGCLDFKVVTTLPVRASNGLDYKTARSVKH